MKLHKYILLGLIIITTAFSGSGCVDKHVENPSTELSEYIEQVTNGKVDELSLTIYYMNPYILTNIPVSERDLVEKYFEYKITISGQRLREHFNLLEQVANATLTPAEQESGVNARLYYVFETKENRKILSVCMWGKGKKLIVNGLWVEVNDAFYDVVLPFLPVDAAEEMGTYLKSIKAK